MLFFFSSPIWWGPHSLCHLPKVNQHTWTWATTSPPLRPELKPVFSHYSWILPPHLQHWAMAGRGGTTRTNGTAVSNKICQFKLVLLGESAVGKSSLVLRFVKGQFHEYQESTIGGTAESTSLHLHIGDVGIKHVPAIAKQLQTC